MDNIFKIYYSLGHEVPFVARRTAWKNILVIVDDVYPNGNGYGAAYGRIYDKRTGVIEPYKKIANAGTYSWIYEGRKL